MSANALRLLEGRTLDGRYLLDEWIGGGSFGGVFLAGEYVDDRRLRTVAAKLLPAEPGDAGDAQCRELEVSLNLDHPNLVRCFSAGRCGVEGFDVLYLTMEVAEGSLEARLQESRLSESETRELALSLASALSHLHAKKLVHRDVKPGNVLKVGDAWKLADFGSVRAVEKSTAQASKNIGTASYAPPEAYEGSVSSAWDVWSLGCLLQEAATGVLPFEADTPTALMHRVLTGDPAIPADLPSWLDGLVRACLNKERSQRPAAKDLPEFPNARPEPAVVADPPIAPRASSAREEDQDPAQFKLLRTLQGHTNGVRSVAFSSDGQTLASCGDDRTVRLWDIVTCRRLRTLEGNVGLVLSISLSPDARTLAIVGGDATVRLWEATTGRLMRTLQGHSDWVSSVAYSPDGRTLASGSRDGSVRLWEASEGRLIRTLNGHVDWVWSIAFSPDGRTIASGGEVVRLWEAADGRLLRTLEGHSYSVSSLAFSPDGRTIASGSDDSTVCLWDVVTGRLLRTLKDQAVAAFSPDGRTIASGSDDSTVCLWEAADGRLLSTLGGHADRVRTVAFSPDGRTLASGGNDATIRVWRLRDQTQSGQRVRGTDLVARPSSGVSPEFAALVAGKLSVSPDALTMENIRDIESLNLSGSRVQDADLVHLKSLSLLHSLNLCETQVTDAGLEHLQGLTELQNLYLWGTRVTDAGLVHLKNLPRLRELSLWNPNTRDTGLEHLKRLTGLEELYLGKTQVTDAGLAHLSSLIWLQTLDLRDTRVTDAGLAYLKGLLALRSLDLENTQVTNAGLVHLKSLTGLKKLRLVGTRVTNLGLVGFRWQLPNCSVSI